MTDLQDQIRELWMADIPRHLRKSAGGAGSNASRMAAEARAKRDEVAPEILAMHRRGVGVQTIARTMGKAANTITRILRENGIDPNRKDAA